MRNAKYYTTGALWTLALALPAALIALAVAAVFDLYLFEVGRGLTAALQAAWEGLASGFGGRWPEVVGMLIGQLLLMAVLLIGGSKVRQRDVQAG